MWRKRRLCDEPQPIYHRLRSDEEGCFDVLLDGRHWRGRINDGEAESEWKGALRFPKRACGVEHEGVVVMVKMRWFVEWRALEREDGPLRTVLGRCPSLKGEKELLVVPDEQGDLCSLCGCDLHWGEMLHALERRRLVLLDMTAHISTLGGGWASVGKREKAHQFALQQKRIARMLGDETLELLSDIYIAYGYLFQGQAEKARDIIDQQTRIAMRRKEKRQLAIVEAAQLQLAREVQNKKIRDEI